MLVDVPCSREDIVVLPEVIRGLVPITAVSHLVTGRDIVAVGVLGEVAVGIVGQILIERVILAQPCLIHILIGLDTRLGTVCAVHQREVVITCRHTIPGLSRLLEVTDVLIADLEVIPHPSQSTIIRT